MSNIQPVDPERTEGKVREHLEAVQKMLGGKPNLFRVAAQSPVALEALVALFGATSKGALKGPQREAIALTVSEANGCDYCLSAHTAIGKGAGMTDEVLAAARDASSADPKLGAILRFAREVTVNRGRVRPDALDAVRRAGATDAEILETITNVALNVLTNYVNIIADTEIDFPLVRSRS